MKTRVNNPEVKRWRKRNKRYAELKPKAMSIILNHFSGDPEQVVAWMKAPHPTLKRPPIELLQPWGIRKLYTFVAKQFTS